MENTNLDYNKYPTTKTDNEVYRRVENMKRVPNKDIEFKEMMWKEEQKKEANKNLETDDWSMHDGQYPRLGPIIFNKNRNTSLS